MKTVYDLLDIAPDATAEAVKAAFRAAVKLHHPDHHPGEPNAALRFRRVTAAYAILRDTEQRAAYDRQLALEHRRIRSMRRRVIISDVACGVVTVMLAIGFLWMETLLSKPVRTNEVELNIAGARTEMAAVQWAARNDAAGRKGLRDGLEETPETASEPGAAGPATETAVLQAIAGQEPARRSLPNALGDTSPDRLGRVSAQH
jgi:curved DNA-binding protein CbpA